MGEGPSRKPIRYFHGHNERGLAFQVSETSGTFWNLRGFVE